MSPTVVTINPATGTELASYPAMTTTQIDAALAKPQQPRSGGHPKTSRFVEKSCVRRQLCCVIATTNWPGW